MRLYLMRTHILVQPIPLRLGTIAPIEEAVIGSAILLLPHGIPAFYLGQHIADDRTVSSFSETIGQNCKHNEISNDFARCFIPIRHLNESQDGALTTIWPRKLMLSTPERPKLPIISTSVQSPMSATFKEDRTRLSGGAPLYLTSLSLRTNPNLVNLSSSLGIYVDSAMKERERPKSDLPRSIQASTSQKQLDTPEVAPFSLVSQPVQHVQPMEIVPQGNLAPAAAQSYPSPLEMMAIRANVNPEATSNDLPSSEPQSLVANQTPVQDVIPAEAPRVDDSSATAQSQYSASHTAMDPWDSVSFGMGNFGFPDTPGMGFNPFSSTSMAQDDFNFNLFDIPTVPPESIEMDPPSVSQPPHDANANSLPDIILALANQATEGEFPKLESSLMQWHDSDASGPYPSAPSLETNSTLLTDATQMMQPNFTLDPFGNLVHSSNMIDTSSSSSVIPLLSDMSLGAEISKEIDEEMAESETGFLALRFGKDHHLADEKYSSGKYSLPSPPPDGTDSRPPLSRLPSLYKKQKEDPRQKPNLPASPVRSSTAREGELRARYLTATSPSRAMLVKLAGVKRNWDVESVLEAYGSPEAHINGIPNSESPAKRRRLTWGSSNEAWRSPTPPKEQNEDDDDDADTSLAGDEDWEADMNTAVDDPEVNGSIDWHKFDIFTQQQDPIKLLQASFNFLLIKEQELATPVDINLPDISSFNSTRLSNVFQMPAPVSVPTPVSPEALPGGNDATVHISTRMASQVARQLCFNALWRAAVIATGTLDFAQSHSRRVVSSSELNALIRILKGTHMTRWGKTVSEVCAEDESWFLMFSFVANHH
jgi:hypothetical protein